MEQLTFSQHVAANGGSLPWQDAVRLTLLTIQTISAQADPETTYMDVCPEQIVLSKDAREVLSCGKPHSLKEWDAADAANPQLLPWEFWNAWSARTPAAQVYPVAACLFGALSGHLPMAAKARLNGAALRTLSDIPDALNDVLPGRPCSERRPTAGRRWRHSGRLWSMPPKSRSRWMILLKKPTTLPPCRQASWT